METVDILSSKTIQNKEKNTANRLIMTSTDTVIWQL